MATFRQLILTASNLAQGATLREHLNNLKTGSGTGTDRTFFTPFDSSVITAIGSNVSSSLGSNIVDVKLESSIEMLVESRVTK